MTHFSYYPLTKRTVTVGGMCHFLTMSQSIFSIRYVKDIYTEKHQVPMTRFHIVKHCYVLLLSSKLLMPGNSNQWT